MNQSVKVLTLATCALLATSTLTYAQTPSSPDAPVVLNRVPTFAPAPAAPRSIPMSGYEWQGFYGGGTLGYGGSLSDTSFSFLPSEVQFGSMNVTLNPAPMGWTYGFHGGYNMTSGNLVYGFEADYLWSSIKGQVSLNPVPNDDGSDFNGTYTVDQQLKWYSTVRGRFGVVCKDNYMIYGTGGIAWGSIENFAEANFLPQGSIVYTADAKDTHTGWTIGAGIEGALTERLAWRAQFLYMDFGKTEVTADPAPANPPFQVRYELKNATNSFTFGVSYRF